MKEMSEHFIMVGENAYLTKSPGSAEPPPRLKSSLSFLMDFDGRPFRRGNGLQVPGGNPCLFVN